MADVLRERPDPVETAAALDRRADAHLLPCYLDQTLHDESRLAALRHTVPAGPPLPPPPHSRIGSTWPIYAPVAQLDPVLSRRLFQLLGMLEHPETSPAIRPSSPGSNVYWAATERKPAHSNRPATNDVAR